MRALKGTIIVLTLLAGLGATCDEQPIDPESPQIPSPQNPPPPRTK